MKKVYLLLVFTLQYFIVLSQSWQQMNGPFGGGVRCFGLMANKIFVGTDLARAANGSYVSTDSGATWKLLPNAPLFNSFLVHGTEIFVAGSSGIWMSPDSGVTWISRSKGLNVPYGKYMAAKGDTLFVGTFRDSGVYRSTNDGVLWTTCNTGLRNKVINTIAVSGNNVLAGTSKGTYISSNNGDLWRLLDSALFANSFPNCFLNAGNTLFVSTSKGIFSSTDNGESWILKDGGYNQINTKAFAVMGNKFFTGFNGVSVSTDSCSSWRTSNKGFPSGNLAVAFGIMGRKLLVANLTGIYTSIDSGTTWTRTDSGFTDNPVNGIATDGNKIFAATNGGIFSSVNNGSTWKLAGFADTVVNSLAYNDGIIAAGTSAGLFLSKDGGSTWKEPGTSYLGGYCVNMFGNTILTGSDGGISVSSDKGVSWSSIFSMNNILVSALAVLGSTYIAGTDHGIYVSSTGKNPWKQNGLADTAVNALAISGTSIFAGTGYGVYLSTDNGNSWKKFNNGFGSVPYISSLLPVGSELISGAGGRGVFITDDNTPAWTKMNNGLQDLSVISLSIKGSYLFAGTGGGVWRYYSHSFCPSAITVSVLPGTTFCQGSTVTFSAAPSNGGATPFYQWKINGVSTGSNSPVFTTTSLNDADSVYCMMTSSDTCTAQTPVISNIIKVTVNPIVTPSVSISALPGDTICTGTSVKFIPTPVNGGASPTYGWYVNGSYKQGGTTFSSTSLKNNDAVKCVMNSNAACTTISTATSNIITINIAAVVTPSVTILSNPSDSICMGNITTLTATSGNGGSSPTYQWYKNGVAAGINSPAYSTLFSTGGVNIIKCLITSNANCANPDTASSSVSLNVISASIPVAEPATNLSGSHAIANWDAAGNATNYFMDVSKDNSFASFVPGYNNLNVGNVTTYNITGLIPLTTYYYRVRVAGPCDTTTNSDTISFTTKSCGTFTAGSVSPSAAVICAGGSITLTLANSTGGNFQWQISGDNISWKDINGAINNSYTTSPVDASGKKYYRCLVNDGCYQLSSDAATVDISITPVIKVTNLTATSVTISWAPQNIGCYNITWSGAAGNGSAMAVTANPYTISGLLPNSDIIITVTSSCSSCQGVSNVQVTSHTLCDAPIITNLIATSSPSHGFKISWTKVGGVNAYRVFYRDITSAATWSFADTAGSGKTVLFPAGGHTYAVYVVALNCPNAGNYGQGSQPILYVNTNPPSGCSPAPTVAAMSNCPNQITVNISGGSPPYQLTLRRISPSVFAASTYKIKSNSLNLTVGTQYAGSVWEVFARTDCGATGISLPSNIAEVIVKPACPLISNVIASQISCHDFTASWNITDCAGLGITGYYVTLKKSGTLKTTAYSVGLTDHKAFTGLDSSTNYILTVSSITCNGSISASSIPDTIVLPSCRMDISASIDSSAGIASGNREAVTLYPNPSVGQFFVMVDRIDNNAVPVRIELLNQLGEVIQTNINTVVGGHLTEVVNTPAHLSSGIYFVRTTVGANIYVNRIMISKE